jgi:hypothetical protein
LSSTVAARILLGTFNNFAKSLPATITAELSALQVILPS